MSKKQSRRPKGRQTRRSSRPGPQHKTFTGRVQKNAKGFAFLISVQPDVPDAYVAREDARHLLAGDEVEYTLQRRGARVSAQIQKVVSRSLTELVGRIERHGNTTVLSMADGSVFLLPGCPPKLQGRWALARITRYPAPHAAGTARIEEDLGEELTPELDVILGCAQFQIPREFDPRTEEDASHGPVIAAQGIADREREDLRDMPFVTIDGEDAKDFDDAVCVEIPRSGPAFALHVAIADVSHFVREGGALDREARDRATSVYFPGTCVPMLPEILSNNLCSLRPREDRLALVAHIRFDRHGELLDASFCDAVIRTAARLTYRQVHDFAEGRGGPELDRLSEPLNRLGLLYERLTLRRTERGTLDFDLPEAVIETDRRGFPKNVRRAERFEAHRWIEEFMIAANRAVARAIEEAGIPALYRVHEEPAPDAAEEVNALLKRFGIPARIEGNSPKEWSKVLEACLGRRGGDALHQVILRKQRQAMYSPEPLGHFGLALRDYCHFTSPIRRYPDLVVHRALRQLIGRGRRSDKDSRAPRTDYAALGKLTSERERRAMEAERFVSRRKQCWYFAERIGEEFDGRVTGAIARGLFLEMGLTGADGFLPVDALSGDYTFDEDRLCLVRRPGHTTIGVGDRMRIAIARVSVDRGEIELAPVGKSG